MASPRRATRLCMSSLELKLWMISGDCAWSFIMCVWGVSGKVLAFVSDAPIVCFGMFSFCCRVYTYWMALSNICEVKSVVFLLLACSEESILLEWVYEGRHDSMSFLSSAEGYLEIDCYTMICSWAQEINFVFSSFLNSAVLFQWPPVDQKTLTIP